MGRAHFFPATSNLSRSLHREKLASALGLYRLSICANLWKQFYNLLRLLRALNLLSRGISLSLDKVNNSRVRTC
jgi:hypothetical protein